MSIPRPEHPRPQMTRPNWLNLNGEWQFEIDFGDSGRDRDLLSRPLNAKITVPFCPESALSGVAYTDFMAAVWYRKTITLPTHWSGRTLLHFGAVDYASEVWINGQSAGTHRGGYSSFSFDITNLLQPGENTILVCAQDDNRSGKQPRGKQSSRYFSHRCDYTRTTGIWQTVWLENVPDTYIQSMKMIPDPDNGRLHVRVMLNTESTGSVVKASAQYENRAMGEASAVVRGKTAVIVLPLDEVHMWEVGCGRLYDLDVKLDNADEVKSYFGMRTIEIDGEAICINGKVVFQRLILDQGFYPQGIYTAPTDDELKADIQRSLDMGFNGARLHQKMFEERFFYWADQMGYIVWGEHANWGLDITTAAGIENFLPEWMETMARDFNHPALVGWCPFNETIARQDPEVLRQVYLVTKAIDPTRPVIDTSGWLHVVTDIYDIHDYDQDPVSFAKKYGPGVEFGSFFEPIKGQKHAGQPYFMSEYGGIWWNPGDADGWGYGERPESEEAFLVRFNGLTAALLDNPHVCALCYTQLTDVEQEVNGLYTYDRKPKFDPKVIHSMMARKAAIEK